MAILVDKNDQILAITSIKCLEKHLCSYKESHRENDVSERPNLVSQLQQRMIHM